MTNFEKIRSLIDDLKKLREVKIARIIKDLKEDDTTLDVSAFTEFELNYYRNVFGECLMTHRRNMAMVDTSAGKV